MKTLFLTKRVARMGVGFLGGMALGVGVNFLDTEPTQAPQAREGREAAAGVANGTASEGTGAGAAEVFPGASAGERFEEAGVERQKEILRAIGARLAKESTPGLQLGVARVISSLTAQQVAALLEAMPRDGAESARGRGEGPGFMRGGEIPDFVRWALAQKLSSEDAAASLELGKRLKDDLVMGSALAVMARGSGAEVLKNLASLPEGERDKVLSSMSRAGLEKVGGSLSEMVGVLRENKALGKLAAQFGGESQMVVTRFLSAALAQSALRDPEGARTQFAELSAFLQESAPDQSSGGERGRSGGRRGGGAAGSPDSWVLQNTLSQMRTVSPESASAFFDSFSENARSPWMFSDEAISRFQRGGVESAVHFAESQTDPEALRSAALGTWWVLAQRDRGSAVEWIESLPQGAFRQGVLTAVMIDAWNESRTWGSGQAAIEAGAKLASRASQLDYYAALMADRPDRGYSQRGTKTETISQLPLSAAEKEELYRRVAPVRLSP